MIPRNLGFVLSLFLLPAIWAQDAHPPQHLDDLVNRASEFRRLLAAGDRVKAANLVVPSKRKEFLNKPTTSLDNVRVVGLDFVDKDHVSVQVTGQTLISGGEGAQLTEPQVADVWVQEKGIWYFQPGSGEVFSLFKNKDAAADVAALNEIKSNFTLITRAIEIGEMWQGDRKDFPIQFQYTGSAPIRIVSQVDSPVTMIDIASAGWITKDSNQFKITAGADDFDGPFDIPVSFTIYYKSIALDESVRVKGDIRPVFKYRQAPETIAPDSKDEFQVFLTNNTDEAAEFGAFETDGKFYVTHYPRHLGAGEEGVITLKRNLVAATPGTIVRIAIQHKLKGKQLCEIRIH